MSIRWIGLPTAASVVASFLSRVAVGDAAASGRNDPVEATK